MQGFNMGRYYPPDMDPRTKRWNQRHPLGSRARKLGAARQPEPAPGRASEQEQSHRQEPAGGSLVVRFEMPFDVSCQSCHTSIAQGRRFNADKAAAGSYFSTPIWRFTARCPSCSARFAIQTDPERTCYKAVDGVTERVKQWDDDRAGTWSHEFRDELAPKEEDPFSLREKAQGEVQARQAGEQRTAALRDDRDRFWSDPASQNARLRSELRAEKRRAFAQQRQDVQFRTRIAWHDDCPILPPPSTHETRQLWHQERRNHPVLPPLPSSSFLSSSSARLSSSSAAARRLAAKLTTNTRRQDR